MAVLKRSIVALAFQAWLSVPTLKYRLVHLIQIDRH